MNRWAVLVVAGLFLLTGCAAPVNQSSTPSAKPFPDYPASISAENASEYASQYEEVYRHNTILATTEVETITSITTGCSPTNTTVVGDGFRITVACEFGWMYTDEGSEAVVDGRPYEATYWVGNGLVERTGSTLAETE